MTVQLKRGEARVVLFTVEEGISLHQGEHPSDQMPRSEVIHDLRWSAIQMAQIESRCHRDGRFAPVSWTYPTRPSRRRSRASSPAASNGNLAGLML